MSPSEMRVAAASLKNAEEHSFLLNAAISPSAFPPVSRAVRRSLTAFQQWLYFRQCFSLDFQFLWNYSDDHCLLTSVFIFIYYYNLLILIENY